MRWTKEKLYKLQEMYTNPDISVEEIAKYFGKSKKEIYQIAYKNLISRGTYRDQNSKKCPECKIVFPATEQFFYKNKVKYSKDGLGTYCKECFRKRKNEKRKMQLKKDKVK